MLALAKSFISLSTPDIQTDHLCIRLLRCSMDMQGNLLTGGLPATWAASTAFPAMRGSSGVDGMCGLTTAETMRF